MTSANAFPGQNVVRDGQNMEWYDNGARIDTIDVLEDSTPFTTPVALYRTRQDPPSLALHRRRHLCNIGTMEFGGFMFFLVATTSIMPGVVWQESLVVDNFPFAVLAQTHTPTP